METAAVARATPAPLERLLARLGPWGYSLLAGILVALVASLVAAPALRPVGQIGELNAQLAANPFGHEPNAMAARILTPLASWLLGLRGDRLLVLIAACCVILPAAVTRWGLASEFGAAGALLAGAALGLTLVVRTSLHYGGYADVVTYLLIFLAWTRRARPWQTSVLLLLALLSHERALFLLPWLLWEMWRASRAEAPNAPNAPAAVARRRWIVLVGPALAIVIWLAVRAAILSGREVEHTLGYYLRPLRADPLAYVHLAWPRQALGFASAFQWVWLLLPLSAGRLRRERGRAALLAIGLPLAGAACQMLVAYDSSRLATLAFPCLLPALESGLREKRPAFRRGLALILLAQALTPQVFTAARIVEVMPGWILPW